MAGISWLHWLVDVRSNLDYSLTVSARRRPHGAGEARGAMMVVQTGSEGGGGGVHSVNNSQAGDVESVGGSSGRSVSLGRRMGGGRSPGGICGAVNVWWGRRGGGEGGVAPNVEEDR